MAARVTTGEVRDAIYLPTTFTVGMINQCINVANVIVDDKLQDAGASDAMLKNIELYLSAHFCSVRFPQAFEEEIGGRDSTVKEKRRLAVVGFGFASTSFGQNAINLDETGILGEMSNPKKKSASIQALGPEPDDYETYINRLWC